jgi:hypothetical protein
MTSDARLPELGQPMFRGASTRRATARAWLLGALACALAGAVAPAHAQQTSEALLPMPPTGDTATGDPVAGLLADAVAEYDAARYLEAQALFQRAHALSPSARTLRGIGMASFEAGQYVTALRALRAALAERERPLTEPQRRHVTALIARTEVFVARLMVEAHPPDARLQVDGEEPVREEDGSILLDPGVHGITVLGPGGRSESLSVRLVGGTTRTITVHVASLERGGVSPLVLGGGVLLGVAALGTVAAVATGVLALDTYAQVQQACDGFVCPGASTVVRDRALGLSLATDVVGTVSAVTAALGAALLAVGVAEQAPPPLSVAAGPTGVTLHIGGTF